MVRQKISFGILIFLGFAVVTILYFVVMSGTADVQGTVQVSSKIVSWTEDPPGLEDSEMVSVNGYCIKGPDPDNRLLLSTKNKHKTDRVKYSFAAKEGMRHLIIIYLQLDHLTGDIGQNLELQLMTNIIKKGDLKYDIIVSFAQINGVENITITVNGTGYNSTRVFEHPISKIPQYIKI